MPNTWIDPEEVTVPQILKEAIGGHPLVAETLVRRSFSDLSAARAFLDPEHYLPSPASELPGVEKATIRIHQAVASGETILVWGDFDVDGQTSTTLLVEALREIGAKVEYHIPVRATEGHGIQVETLKKITAEKPAISLLLTCDTGIAALDAVDFANANGLEVIITDHHDLPEVLPPAYAIIDPKLLPDDHPLANLPGVGVAYKLAEALFNRLQQSTGNLLSTEKYLDLVALGIVADVAEQRGDSRYLLQRGLKVLRSTQRRGLQTLMELAQIIPDQLDEGNIGFGIGPRLNALGRLSDANPIVEFLTTDDAIRAQVLATQLEGLNERRKLLTGQITQAALSQIEQNPQILEPAALVLAHPNWHTGVIGIVASRLVEQFGKPTILLSIGADGIARGSARSIEGVHITEAISSQKDLLIGFGGHPGAAGLSLPEADIHLFRRGLGKAVRDQLGDQPPEPCIQIEAYLPLADISLELVNEIRRLGPFGAGNPSLTLATQNLRLISHTPIGRGKEHLRLILSDEMGNHQNVLWWNGAGNPLPGTEIPFDLAYTIQASSYRGERQLQIQWVDYRPISKAPQDPEMETSVLEIVDHRRAANPLALLRSIQAEYDIQIWAEGEAKSNLVGLNRNELNPGESLVVWTTPPGPKEWQVVLDQVQPQRIFLFAIDPGMDDVQTFLGRLAGLVKFAIRKKDGMANLDQLATATAQSIGTVRMGLLWMQAKGYIQVFWQEEGSFYLRNEPGIESSDFGEIASELAFMLKETAAYRAYVRTARDNLT